MSFWRLVVLCLCLSQCQLSWSRDFTLTLQLRSGTKECFYEYIHEGAFLEVEYQVTRGGDLDINFVINDPNGTPLVFESHRKDGLHGVDIKVTGEFEICLDNEFSHLTDKWVFFDIIIEDDSGETVKPPDVVPYQLSKEAVIMDMKVKDIKSKLDEIGKKLDKVISTQNYFQARESRHRHTVESNHRRVTWWSLLECTVILTVGMIQVVVIRNLFKTNRKDRIRT